MVLLEFVESGYTLSTVRTETGFRTMKLLTRRTMAVLRIQRLLPAQLVLDLTAMTACFIASVKVWIVVVDLVGCPVLPLVVLALSISIVAIIAIRAICGCVFSHASSTGVKLEQVEAGKRSVCWTDGA